MKRIKRTVFIICSVFTAVILSTHVCAYNWYFKVAEKGKQPILCPEADFVEKYDVVTMGNDSEKKIYLTFDAGYENGNVEKTLDILRDNNVKGTFFVLPHLVKENTDLCKRMKEEGHLVGNHTVHHSNMSKSDSEDFFKSETLPLDELFLEKTGYEMDKFFRPPEGAFNENTLKYAQKYGYTTVFWSLAYADWDKNNQQNPDKALQLLLSRTHNGCVLLLHPTSETNVLILDEYIKTLKNEGYEFCLVSQLAGDNVKS